jgi:hypothetical protein
LFATVLCALLTAGACAPGPSETAAPAGWQKVADSPLGPREQALGLWTGREVLLIGGSDAEPCMPNADCAVDPTPLTDGAAYEPGTGRWRPLAASPVPLLGAQGVVLGPSAYVLPNAERPELFVHRIDRNTWTRLAVPFHPQHGYRLLAAGGRLVAYQSSDENAPGDDYVLDPATSAWTALPADPLGKAFNRGMAWSGRELMLFDHELIPHPGADGPALTRIAALDLTTGTWRRLPDAPMLSTGPWLLAGDRLVNPSLGGADGGRIGNWGRPYPNGGIVGTATGAWSALPDPPGGATLDAEALGGGARTGTSAVFVGLTEYVLDTTTSTWQSVPALPGGRATGYTVVAAGGRMLVSGGARWGRSEDDGTLLATTWIWTPGR